MITFSKIGSFGRLGNQLFQVASTIGIAKHYKTTFGFLQVPSIINLAILNNNSFDRGNYRENRFEFDMPELDPFKNWDLHGYFQSYRYFDWCWDEIEHYFEFNADTIQRCNDHIFTFNHTDIVSVHVRRGDYLNLQQYHPVQTKEYYLEAMSHFPEGAQFLIFSDDPEWCKQNFRGNNIQIIHETETIDLCLMSMCDHNIIANSSFSWWGAWLNNNPNKKVIAPKKWFGEAYADKSTKDLIPSNWIQL